MKIIIYTRSGIKYESDGNITKKEIEEFKRDIFKECFLEIGGLFVAPNSIEVFVIKKNRKVAKR